MSHSNLNLVSRTTPAHDVYCWALGFMVCSLSMAAGCGSEPSKPTTTMPDTEHTLAAGHPEEGPHHGELIELGKEEYHAEMIHDDVAHKVTIYLLDFAAVHSVAIAERELTINVAVAGKPQQFKLLAVPQADDAAGQSSRFELTDQALCEALDDPKTTGRLNVPIAGKSYSGDLNHAGHDHNHKH